MLAGPFCVDTFLDVIWLEDSLFIWKYINSYFWVRIITEGAPIQIFGDDHRSLKAVSANFSHHPQGCFFTLLEIYLDS